MSYPFFSWLSDAHCKLFVGRQLVPVKTKQLGGWSLTIVLQNVSNLKLKKPTSRTSTIVLCFNDMILIDFISNVLSLGVGPSRWKSVGGGAIHSSGRLCYSRCLTEKLAFRIGSF